MSSFGMPGPGGSLGCCAYCGKPFLAEVLLGTKVQGFTLDGCKTELFAHKACYEKLSQTKEFKDLPAESPLRQTWEARQKEKVEP